MTVSADAVALLGRAGLDLLTLLILVGWLYKGQRSAPSMPFLFTSLNLGIFAAVTAFTATRGVLTVGLSFGLFAVLQMIRLRSVRFTVKDVAFTFLALITGLINALPGLPWQLIGCLDLLILVAVAVTGVTRDAEATQIMRLTLDRAYSDPAEIRSVVQERLGLRVESIVIKQIDFVQQTTELQVYYVLDPARKRSTADEVL